MPPIRWVDAEEVAVPRYRSHLLQVLLLPFEFTILSAVILQPHRKDNPVTDFEVQIRALIDRQQIYEVLTRYARGVDRGDVELIRSVYHPDATDDHGMFKGLGVDFAPWIVDYLKDWKQCQHFLGNFSCDLQGDVAYTETYCLSISDDAQGHNSTVYNRYIDRFERRDGEWRIADRLVVLDLTRVDPVTESFDSVPGWNFSWGRRNTTDPSYRFAVPTPKSRERGQ